MIEKNNDIQYMRRCIELAAQGEGHTYPNPMVGSVIVHNNKIIGEGFHRKYGEVHAEVNAINSVEDKSLFKESTIYVNLEPCAHHGKTPPCADLIVQHKFKRVVIGCRDSFKEVDGKGIEIIKNAGIEVTTGILEEESIFLNRRFFTFHNNKRPYIILKWAQTADGYIDSEREEDNNSPKWITNDLARALVHRWRSDEMGIMIGTNTALMDNPKLNVREWTPNNPTRIILDRTLRLPVSLNIFDNSQPTRIYIGNNASAKKNKKEFTETENLKILNIDYAKDVISQVMTDLYEQGIQSVIVEGGTKLIESFYKNNCWDESRVFVGNTFFAKGVKAPEVKGKHLSTKHIDNCNLYTYINDTLSANNEEGL
ncbi:MAG: bifunctional diaminohydroxyphosphoribosylaminopyrimidine deaminase/5-amino-6-(5-phosphoribosylamino)uracil reductase RibD [Bacteroidales bacterium]|jgi:diaminohydroxyphosphoribosylaminopyrimidine deaminase/5-amino-6-(5-phosphoribosylamino)uracil reductase|nr:bifunctional diaminohydroxyphosphoribosylaminopyrimidine deaminase/5-amino-6-(5-phosphoribosylamino)uracil reductase RibD [Bacteroidales bacterium]